MEEKYIRLHRYLDSVTIDPQQAFFLTEAMISYFMQWFKLSRAEVLAGTIQFCKRKGIQIHFKQSPPANTNR
ncbi:hypothetical protein Q0590_34740 [Rhodocytophaga aerolata]|uniref:Uncharacterized protein n=1 Tax=Rhodocytophaga aerolata TaxID=455078 RepID=A0ABT8RHB2_9BACT|nr:hypothetical protein [Rhodocytophaga aerolata]MDO1451484.1 hypothetical protein [Rhodocytophaga aerolata]